MEINKWILSFCLLLFSFRLMAWDEVTHGFITNMAIDRISDPELKTLLKENRGAFLYGSWFTDTYQYTDHRVEALNPHILQAHIPAFSNYLRQDKVKRQANYDELMAIFLGSVAHAVEDFWLDFILYDIPSEEKGDTYTGDAYNGVINIKLHNYLGLEVDNLLPVADLHQVYQQADLLDPPYSDQAHFNSTLKKWGDNQFLKLRLLKLLSFLASDQLRNESPWTAAHMMAAPGGISDCADQAARLVEASWKKIYNREADGILHAAHIPYDNSVAILTSFPVTVELIPDHHVFVTDHIGDTINGRMEQMKYGNSDINRTNVVLKFHPDSNLESGQEYLLHMLPGAYGDGNEEKIHDPVSLRFIVRSYESSNNLSHNSAPFIQTLWTGTFLFILSISLSGIFFGLSGTLLFARHAYFGGNVFMPIAFARRICEAAGVVFLGLGIYMLFTKGWIVILNI